MLNCLVSSATQTADSGANPTFDYVPAQSCDSSQWQYRCGIRSRGSDAAVLGGETSLLLFSFVTDVHRVGGVLPLVLSRGGKLKGVPTV